LRDLLGVPISIGTVHRVLQLATQRAGVVNRDQDLFGIRVGLHDEIFQGAMPVLAGVDAAMVPVPMVGMTESDHGTDPCAKLIRVNRQGEGGIGSQPERANAVVSLTPGTGYNREVARHRP
jgi:hypothetical protein